MKTMKMLALALVLIGATTAANAATTFLATDDFVGISFWLISMGMLAATAFFFMEQANVSAQWRKSVNVSVNSWCISSFNPNCSHVHVMDKSNTSY